MPYYCGNSHEYIYEMAKAVPLDGKGERADTCRTFLVLCTGLTLRHSRKGDAHVCGKTEIFACGKVFSNLGELGKAEVCVCHRQICRS